jgi:hypothetical protein
MARLSIDLPDEFIFSAKLIVLVSDINYSGPIGIENF